MSTGAETLRLPPIPYVPGRSARPDEGYFDPVKTGLSPALSCSELAMSPAFKGGLEAFSHGYFWEAHELWEAVWMCLPPASAERHLVQGLIQLANAALKRRMGQERAAGRILERADSALEEAHRRHARPMGLSSTDTDALRSVAETSIGAV
ncbi:DUF309 domain-containing protein [Pseudoxanthobacter sp. M-2]|uniref:DUF309 domain-containing protein n=1 Tax=Pseudoxanthobacter sp. M-2 TaxID=3078754 RepID=UPI0038FCA317